MKIYFRDFYSGETKTVEPILRSGNRTKNGKHEIFASAVISPTCTIQSYGWGISDAMLNLQCTADITFQ